MNAMEQFGDEVCDNAYFMNALRKKCVLGKEILSNEDTFTIELAVGNDVFQHSIFREDFEDMCSETFVQCITQVEQLLSRNNLSESDIEQVLLVGGSTRIPKIRHMLHQMFGRQKVKGSLEVDEIVAQGASLIESASVNGITTHSLGTDCVLKSNRFHTYLVIDRSFSMSSDDVIPTAEWVCQQNRLGAVVENAMRFIERRAYESPTDLISVIAFNHEASVVINSSSVNDVEQLRERLNSIVPSHKTDYLSALKRTFTLADSHSPDTLTPLFVMLSDGQDGNPSDDVVNLVTTYFDRTTDAVIHTIGFGTDFSFDRLRTLSQIGHGQHLSPSDSISLRDAFNTLAKRSGAAGQETERCYPLIPRRTQIPYSNTQKFVNLEDNQKNVSVKVLEGESEWAAENSLLGQFSVPIELRPAGQNEVFITFAVDNNSILRVTAEADGEAKMVTIDQRPGVLTDDQMAANQDQINRLMQLRRRRQ
ncbi:hypothetical protein GEMRC1_001027 [Eukaryota sp. GEM-RC1]